MNESRGPWYLLTGLVLGAVLGVLYAWMVQPVQYTDTGPSSLRADFKEQYRALIAVAYMANGDLLRARARLDLLKDDDIYRTLAEQAQRTLAGGSSLQEARALGMLAVALGQAPAAAAPVTAVPTLTYTVPPPAATSAPPTLQASATLPVPTAAMSGTLPAITTVAAAKATLTPTITPTQRPTRTPSPTPGAPYVLESRELVCETDPGAPLIQVLAFDAAGQGVPGVEVVVNWNGGENHFFTGLQPELGPGYADFEMSPGVVYSLRLAEGGQPISDLTPTECSPAGGNRYWGVWKLVFKQP